ncbi:hypothetical protein T459_09361 [Capsicum annuum]|uniref:Inhibitor I9 domain-containing protein n=1 Tax=Capsicum annuum TaxID=4072 RepID=A0A2G2ZZ58_CAPAN|nr:hypothetical protein T459_09361 [Capsicum annuum]
MLSVLSSPILSQLKLIVSWILRLVSCSPLSKRKNAVAHSYKNSFSGIAARLSDAEARSLAQHPGVVSVFPDQEYGLNQRVSMTRVSVQFHRDGKELASEIMTSKLPAATSNNL